MWFVAGSREPRAGPNQPKQRGEGKEKEKEKIDKPIDLPWPTTSERKRRKISPLIYPGGQPARERVEGKAHR